MSKGASKTMIGGFVVGAVALLLVAVLIFGSGKFFSNRVKAVLFFEESVNGLTVGAPVVFRGVTIGSVTDVELWSYPHEMKVQIPVYIEIDPSRFKIMGDAVWRDLTFKRQIEKGLRAQIKMQSLVTGQLMVYADYFPDKPIHLVKAEPRYPEIPTIPSGTEEIKKALEQIPVKEIVVKVTKALEGIENLINSPQTVEVTKNLNAALDDFRKAAGDVQKLARNVDAQINPLATEAKNTLADTRKLIQGADREILPLAAGLKKALDEAGMVLGETRQTLKKAASILSDESTLSAEFLLTMDEINRTMRSIQLLADYIHRHPEALLRGKSPSGGK
jgi:paraquat-inducible protein B